MRLKQRGVGWNNDALLWAAGFILWLLLLPFPLAEGVLDPISKLLLLAILFFSQMLLFLVAGMEEQKVVGYQLLRALQMVALLPVVISFLVQRGVLAGVLASVWLLFTMGLALYGILRLLPWQRPRPEEAVISAGLLYLPVGAGWLVLSRLGVNPLGFSDAIVLLTAIHFHYAGFAIPILVGMTGRMLARLSPPPWATALYRAVVTGVIVGPPLIALGITFSRPLEVGAASLFAGALMAFALLTLLIIVPRLGQRMAQSFLALSSLLLLFTMLLALGYAVGGSTGWVALTIPQMVRFHGWGNALVVCFALLGWVKQRATIVFRPFETRDQATARRLIQEGLAERFGHLDETLNPDLNDIQATYLLAGHCFLVAEGAGELVGTGALLIHDGEVGQMVRLSVRRDHRGQGLGRRLVERLIDVARQRGLTRLIVETNHDWHDALALYQRCGFTPYQEAEGNIYMEMRLE